MESLCLNWEQKQLLLDDVDDIGHVATKTSSSLCGTLTLSSKYISVSIHVQCHWKKYNQSDYKNDERGCERRDNNDDGDVATAKQFQEELFFKLTASAIESKGGTKDDAKKQNRNDCKARKKLRAEMLKRLRSDHYIQRLFADKKEAKSDSDSALLCEALIQQNLRSGDVTRGVTNIDELEERVNVEEGTLQGIKNAIFSKSEDNLDVLEVLLNMPYLPRSSPPPSSDNDEGDTNATSNQQWPTKLAERAYLRLLEDAMFDACEKEGEDELLDDLNISETNQYRHTAAKSDEAGSGRNLSSKRTRNK